MPTPQTDRFGAKLLAFWKKAVENEVKLVLPSRAEATALRHRLYRLRSAMEKEDHELAPLAKRVVIRIQPFGDSQYHLIATHADKQFDDLLKDFNIDETPEI